MPPVKLDENVPDSVGTILREAGHDVVVARDEHLAGVPDDRVLAVARPKAVPSLLSIVDSRMSFSSRRPRRPESL